MLAAGHVDADDRGFEAARVVASDAILGTAGLLLLATGLLGGFGLSGLAERLLAAFAAAVGLLAVGGWTASRLRRVLARTTGDERTTVHRRAAMLLRANDANHERTPSPPP